MALWLHAVAAAIGRSRGLMSETRTRALVSGDAVCCGTCDEWTRCLTMCAR
jgi:hypothetical protein